jgi:hypothetical protein
VTLQSNALGLYIPKQRLREVDAPYGSPKEAEKWISDLPMAHIGESSRLVYKALAEINRVSMSVSQRFKLMELYHQPVDYLTRALTKNYLGQPFPLSKKHQKISELTRELQWEMAIGYKIIIDAHLSGFGQKVDNKVFVAAIHRAMYYLGQSLVKSFEVYATPPENCWLEAHHLFLFAEHNNIEGSQIKDVLDKKNTSSILDLYKKILLLTVANPYRLPQTEINKLYDALNTWVDQVNILPLSTLSNPSGLFVIDLDKDLPPNYLHHNKHDSSSTQLRVIDTSSLTRVIRDQIGEQKSVDGINQSQTRYFGLLPETVKRIVTAWGAIPKRNFSRTGKDIPVNIALGLSATHYFIDKSQQDEEQVHYTEKASFIDKMEQEPNSQPVSQPDVWDVADNPSLQIPDQFEVPTFLDESYKTEIQEFEDPDQDLYESHRCILVNESAGGFCIRWKTDMPLRTMVGSLIGIRRLEKADNPWTIGVIRWMKNKDEEIFLGIELLAPKADAIAAKNVSHKARVTDYTRCLLLPEAKSVNLPRTIIAPSLYRIGEKLRLDVHGQKVKVKLTKLLESTSTFSQFQFNIIQSAEKVTPTDKLDRIKNFDAIWSSI